MVRRLVCHLQLFVQMILDNILGRIIHWLAYIQSQYTEHLLQFVSQDNVSLIIIKLRYSIQLYYVTNIWLWNSSKYINVIKTGRQYQYVFFTTKSTFCHPNKNSADNTVAIARSYNTIQYSNVFINYYTVHLLSLRWWTYSAAMDLFIINVVWPRHYQNTVTLLDTVLVVSYSEFLQ